MHVKRFEAATLVEALRDVRETFGPDALVLSTRQVRRDGGWFGRAGRPVVEVTAAIDRDARPAASAQPPGAPARERVAPDPTWKELRLTRALIEPLENEVGALRQAVERLDSGHAVPLADEIAELRRVARGLARPPAESGATGGSDWAQRLLGAGLAPAHAESLGAEAERRAADGRGGDAALVESLAARLDSRLAPAREDDAPLSIYVGPTGGGKTTSLAKVAAREAGGSGGDGPALVSTDAHRLGADAALRAYARELALPFDLAVSEAALCAAVQRRGQRRMLVDTAGRSPADAGALAELRALRSALGHQARVSLVVSATTKERDLERTLAWFRPLEPDALVITKLDESGDLGNVANLLLDGDAPPLAWLGDGQRVPQDLLVPDPRALASRILGVPT